MGGSPGHHNGREMSVAVRADRESDQGYLVPSGPFDLAHAAAVERAVEDAAPRLQGCRSVEVDLAHLDRIDGTGAVLLARLLDRLDAGGRRTHVVERRQPGSSAPDRPLSRTRSGSPGASAPDERAGADRRRQPPSCLAK